MPQKGDFTYRQNLYRLPIRRPTGILGLQLLFANMCSRVIAGEPCMGGRAYQRATCKVSVDVFIHYIHMTSLDRHYLYNRAHDRGSQVRSLSHTLRCAITSIIIHFNRQFQKIWVRAKVVTRLGRIDCLDQE